LAIINPQHQLLVFRHS